MTVVKVTGETVYHENLDWREFVNQAKERIGRYCPDNRNGQRTEFAGCTFDEALEMATGKGYEDALPEVEKMLEDIEHDIADMASSSFEQRFDVAGSYVDIGRYLSGEPECMVEATPIHVMRTGRVLKLAVPVCYSGGIEKDVILRRGVGIMALVDAMTKMQHPLEIWAVCAIHNGDKYHYQGPRGGDKALGAGKARMSISVKVQDANQPLDMGRVMYALAHPSMLRQLFFAYEDGIEDQNLRRAFGMDYGRGRPSFACHTDDLQPIDVHNAIVLPDLDYYDRWNKQTTLAWIKENIERVREG